MGEAALHLVLAPEHDGIRAVVGVLGAPAQQVLGEVQPGIGKEAGTRHLVGIHHRAPALGVGDDAAEIRSEEHTSELQSLMRISYAVFCLKTKTNPHARHKNDKTHYTISSP